MLQSKSQGCGMQWHVRLPQALNTQLRSPPPPPRGYLGFNMLRGGCTVHAKHCIAKTPHDSTIQIGIIDISAKSPRDSRTGNELRRKGDSLSHSDTLMKKRTDHSLSQLRTGWCIGSPIYVTSQGLRAPGDGGIGGQVETSRQQGWSSLWMQDSTPGVASEELLWRSQNW